MSEERIGVRLSEEQIFQLYQIMRASAARAKQPRARSQKLFYHPLAIKLAERNLVEQKGGRRAIREKMTERQFVIYDLYWGHLADIVVVTLKLGLTEDEMREEVRAIQRIIRA